MSATVRLVAACFGPSGAGLSWRILDAVLCTTTWLEESNEPRLVQPSRTRIFRKANVG